MRETAMIVRHRQIEAMKSLAKAAPMLTAFYGEVYKRLEAIHREQAKALEHVE